MLTKVTGALRLKFNAETIRTDGVLAARAAGIAIKMRKYAQIDSPRIFRLLYYGAHCSSGSASRLAKECGSSFSFASFVRIELDLEFEFEY